MRRFIKILLLGLIGLLSALTVAVLAVAYSQDGSVKVLQSVLYGRLGREPNSFAPVQPANEQVRQDGLRVKTNIAYGARFPNSFLDIWYAPSDAGVKRPTVVYLHGGGYFMGSKNWGDPFANDGKADALAETVATMAKAGFNVANLDYALSPEYRYPTPLIQQDEAFSFLSANADRLGLDMNRLFLMGGSAGAQISAQYGLLLSDDRYASSVGVKPSIARNQVRGLVLFSPPLKASGRGWRFNTMAWAYLGTKNLTDSKQALEMDIVPKVGGHYPATYITDGNQPDTFPDDAKALARALQYHRVDHAFNYYEPTEAKLDHGYTGRLDTRWGRDNLNKAIAFMKERQ